jgi:hypothetical protein
VIRRRLSRQRETGYAPDVQFRTGLATSIDRKWNIQAAFLGRRNLRAGSSMNS